MCGFKVHIHRDDETPPDLGTLLELPQASFFHTPQWQQALQRASPRYRSWIVAVRHADGTLHAACPFVAVARFGLVRLYAGAHGTYGGVLARTPEAARCAARAIEELSHSRRVVLVRVHDFSDTLTAELGRRWARHAESCQVLDLDDDAQTLFRDAFTSQNRNKIRKAERAGVGVRRSTDRAALRVYARLYQASARRWHLRRALPTTLFTALAEAGDAVDVWVAERHGEPLAALLNLRGGGQIMNWGNVSEPEAWRFAPNNLLHWRAIEAGCLDRDGPRLYNFGSSAGLPGVHAFKAAFGAREHAYTRLEYASRLVSWTRR